MQAASNGNMRNLATMAKSKNVKKKEIVFKTTLTADELFKKAIATPIKNSKVKKK